MFVCSNKYYCFLKKKKKKKGLHETPGGSLVVKHFISTSSSP